MGEKNIKIITTGIIGIFSLLFAFLIMQKSASVSEPSLKKSEISTESVSVKNTISITIIAGNKTLHTASYAGASLYEALLSAKENRDIMFFGKNYPGLGFFLTDIGSLHSGDGKYLFYYINNKEASVGVSSYTLKDGDVIEWKLK